MSLRHHEINLLLPQRELAIQLSRLILVAQLASSELLQCGLTETPLTSSRASQGGFRNRHTVSQSSGAQSWSRHINYTRVSFPIQHNNIQATHIRFAEAGGRLRVYFSLALQKATSLPPLLRDVTVKPTKAVNIRKHRPYKY